MSHREPAAGEEPTIGKLIVDTVDDVGSLVRQLIELAKSELTVSLKFGITGLVLFALAGFISLLGVIMGSVAIVYFIHLAGIGLAWSFLIVFGGYLLLAGLLAFIGYRKVRKVRAPKRALTQAQDVKAALSQREASHQPAHRPEALT